MPALHLKHPQPRHKVIRHRKNDKSAQFAQDSITTENLEKRLYPYTRKMLKTKGAWHTRKVDNAIKKPDHSKNRNRQQPKTANKSIESQRPQYNSKCAINTIVLLYNEPLEAWIANDYQWNS